MSDTSKTAKIIKTWYHSPSHRLTVNVLLNIITFLWFLLFSMCHLLHVAVNKCINWCFVHLYLLFYYNDKVLCWWSIINHLHYMAIKTLNLKYFGGSRFWFLEVTWRHRNVIIGLVKSTFLLVVNNPSTTANFYTHPIPLGSTLTPVCFLNISTLFCT